jgi:hypothetical protein
MLIQGRNIANLPKRISDQPEVSGCTYGGAQVAAEIEIGDDTEFNDRASRWESGVRRHEPAARRAFRLHVTSVKKPEQMTIFNKRPSRHNCEYGRQ